MDEKNFKRHLRDLVRGKHNTAEHDWTNDRAQAAQTAAQAKKGASRSGAKKRGSRKAA